MTATCDADRAKRTASRCDSFRLVSRGIKSAVASNSGAASPSRTPRSSARRSPFAAAARLQRLPLAQPRRLVVGAVEAEERLVVRVERVVEGDAQQTFLALADDAAPAGVMRPPWSDSSTGEPACSRVHGNGAPPRLASVSDEAAAQAGGFVAHDEVEQTIAAALGLGGGQPADALQRLPGLRLRLHLQEGGQSFKGSFGNDMKINQGLTQRREAAKKVIRSFAFLRLA